MKKLIAIFFAVLFCFTAYSCTAPIKPEEKPPEDITEENFVTYSEFGAKGDGITDDFSAIKETHDYANENGVSVKADGGAKYYIGSGTSAVIRTDTDWGDAEFFIDDKAISIDERTENVFTVSADTDSFTADLPAGFIISAGQTKLPLKLSSPALLYISNSSIKEYIRYGINENSGSARQEIVLVDKNGNVDPTTPVLKDYGFVSRVVVYPIDEKPITIKGGSFTTIANDTPTGEKYYGRGISVRRSNTTLQEIKHYVTEEGETGCPYTGFFAVSYASNVLIENCVVTGHKTYSYDNGKGVVTIGTYDINALRANAVTWKDCTQSNDVTDRTFWGVMGTNFCRNLTLTGCNVSRFDAHQGVNNATIKNSVIGQSITIIGEGVLRIEGVERLSGGNFLQLRNDYGSSWKGEIFISDSVIRTTAYNFCLINANWYDWNFGYTCYLPKVTVDNVRIEGGTNRYVFSAVTGESSETVANSKNPIVLPTSVTIKNSGNFMLSLNGSGLFATVPFTNG